LPALGGVVTVAGMAGGAPFSTRMVEATGGVKLAVHHLGGDGRPVMAVHATGFHGRCWWPLAETLTDEFSVWAIDQRGHGASDRDPESRYDDWDRLALDLLLAVDALGGTGWGAIGHSLGGGVSLLAEARRPGTFGALAVYEPVVIPPEWKKAAGGPGGPVPLADLARKRRPTFASRQAAYDNYRSKPPFEAFDPVALRMYVDFGLVDQPDGTVTLACRREDEAAIFESAPHSPAWDNLPAVRAPVAVLAGASGDGGVGDVADQVARRLPRGGLHRFGQLDHFGPMTAPSEVGMVMKAGLRGELAG
jgi:pimeloyl-ACP methyl ester carboxylesterase